MSKVGVKLKINVSDIKKELLFKGNKGTYLDATVFIDTDQADQYGNHGMITQDVSKESRDAGEKGPILGNCKVFWRDGATTKQEDYRGHPGSNQKNPTYEPSAPSNFDDFDDDLPF